MRFGLVSYHQSCDVLGSLPGLGRAGAEAPGEEKLSGPQWPVANGPGGRYPQAGGLLLVLLETLLCARAARPQQGGAGAAGDSAHAARAFQTERKGFGKLPEAGANSGVSFAK